MKRLGKVLIVVSLTLFGVFFIENVLDFESEPYYVVLLFLLISSAVGLYEYNKKV